MSTQTRRQFFRDAGIGIAASTIHAPMTARASKASERVRIGVIGCGGQGLAHIDKLQQLRDADVVYVSDIDAQRLARAVHESGNAKGVADFRRILDDSSVNGVTIATPDHWHVPAALLSLRAGKHVYVEKPCSHNIREGELLIAATRTSGKVLVHGTQSRSNASIQRAITRLREGVIGDVLVAKCWNWQKRENIGRAKPSTPPNGVDYDTWVGPAEWMPFQENRFHYNWHWWHNFGCGDLGNDGIHDLDYALWGLDIDSHPSAISAAGGKYFFDDDQQFPDTQQITFEYPGDGQVGSRRMLIYEQRLWSTTYPHNVDSGVEYYGTKGTMFISKRGKIELRGEQNRRMDVELDGVRASDVADNLRNWIDCIKSSSHIANANVGVAHRTATAVHLGNIATRLQRTLKFDPVHERFIGDDEANKFLSRSYRQAGHWGVPQGV